MALNVRLNEEESRMAAKLRAAGVQISALVRDAIRTEYARRIERQAETHGIELVRQILEDLPDPPDLPARDFSIRNRKAVQRHIEQRLTQGRR